MGEILFLATYRTKRDSTAGSADQPAAEPAGGSAVGPTTRPAADPAVTSAADGRRPRPHLPRVTSRTEEDPREPLLREVYGDILREIRQDRGERLSDVATRAAISPQYLSEIERGRKDASSEMIAAVARALGVPVRTLSAQVSSRLAQSGPSSPVCLAA